MYPFKNIIFIKKRKGYKICCFHLDLNMMLSPTPADWTYVATLLFVSCSL